MGKDYKPPLISIVILDFNRPVESELLLRSLELNADFDYELVYVSNGGEQDYVQKYYNDGRIDVLVLSKENGGTGLGTKLGFKAASGKYVIYVQVDQWLGVKLNETFINHVTHHLESNSDVLCVDLAGDQGHGNFSERALIINRKRYLDIPDLETAIGGPGPLSQITWSERGVQDYVKRENLKIAHAGTIFGDNGKNSIREYPCGGVLVLTTDEKRLTILKPLKERIDFPNLKLTDVEWELILSNKWVNGTIPEGHRDSSFTVWKRPFCAEDMKK